MRLQSCGSKIVGKNILVSDSFALEFLVQRLQRRTVMCTELFSVVFVLLALVWVFCEFVTFRVHRLFYEARVVFQ